MAERFSRHSELREHQLIPHIEIIHCEMIGTYVIIQMIPGFYPYCVLGQENVKLIARHHEHPVWWCRFQL